MSFKKKGYSSWVELLALLLFDLCLSCCLNSFSQEREKEIFFFHPHEKSPRRDRNGQKNSPPSWTPVGEC